MLEYACIRVIKHLKDMLASIPMPDKRSSGKNKPSTSHHTHTTWYKHTTAVVQCYSHIVHRTINNNQPKQMFL